MARKPTYEELEQRIKASEQQAVSGINTINVSGIDMKWKVDQGRCTFEDLPVAMMWIDTTLAGLMSGVQAMVGTERFGLALQSEGRKSVEDDWKVISQFSEFKDGFKAISNIAAVAGWGDWKLIGLDENKKECQFRVKDSWEGLYQKSLGVCWGSGMLAGKMAGYCSKLFNTNCWAEQTTFIAKGEEFDEFFVKPSERSIEKEIDNLLATDEATRADMAVALQKLQKEISERMLVEEALRQSEEKYKHLTEELSDVVLTVTLDGNLSYVSPAIIEFGGYDPKEEVGNNIAKYFAKNSELIAALNLIEKISIDKTSTSIEFLFKPKNKESFYVEVTGKPLIRNNEVVSIQCVMRDISKRKQAEDALKESEEKYRHLFEMVSDAIFLIRNSDGQILEVNTAGVDLYGFSREELLKLKNTDLSAEPDETRKATLKRKKEIPTRYHKKKDGTVFPVEITGNHFTWRGEEVHIASIRDIAERKQAEEALRESETKFRSLFDLSPQAIALSEVENGRFVNVNDKLCELTQYTKEEIIGFSSTELGFYTVEDRSRFITKLKRSGEVNGLEMDFKAKDGSILNAHVFARIIQIAGEPFILSIFLDLTEQKRLQAQLQQSQKMESVGLLAGGVAHDLNNVLSGIVSYPELLLLDLPEDNKLRKPIETMQESGHRAVAIVQDLLTVARGVAITKAPLNLNDLVSEYLNSPEFQKLKEFHPAVTIKINLDPHLLNIAGSHVHIRKVIMNLVSNASEAIEGSGNVIISTMNRYIDRPLKGYDDVTIGEYAVLSVSDDGSGISSGDLERIFDPFYTKKVLGRSGTGLGLAVVWNVIQDHKGYIDVKSDENGTIFELYFSITRDEIPDKALSISIKDYIGNGERILVVDDVKSQQEISCKMLDTLGYKTQAVSSGEEAIEYLKENTVDLILLDMIMDPGINGRETFEKIIKIHPKQKAIIVSGFAETDDVRETQQLGAGQYIKKPLTIEKIGIAVKGELKK